jgi:hypothetical protein
VVSELLSVRWESHPQKNQISHVKVISVYADLIGISNATTYRVGHNGLNL